MSLRGEPLWAEVRIGLEILEAGTAQPRVCVLNQPFAVIGRLADSHIQIDDRAVSALHAYLHADARGLFVVDLATRTGIRFDGNLAPFGWVRPGSTIEIAGHFIRLTHFEIQGHQTPLPSGSASLLDATEQDLRGLSLDPVGRRGTSWTLKSELVFIGRSDSCGIRLNQANVARTHCALFRTATHAYLVALPGHPTQVDGEIVRPATSLQNGSIISIGQTRFTACIAPLSTTADGTRQDLEHAVPAELRNLPAFSGLAGLPSTGSPPFPLELIPPESRDAVLGWMLGTLHAGQNEIIRRQDELQHSLTLVLKHLQTETSSRLDDQGAKLDALTAELARLSANAKQPTASQPIPPFPTPEPSPRPTRDLPPAPEIDPARSLETAAWLLNRIDKLGHANKFSFKSLLSRRGSQKNAPPSEADSSMHSGEDSAPNDGSEETS